MPENYGPDGKIDAENITIESRAIKKADNFWYHNKWKIIVALFFIVVFVILALQMCNRKSEDITVVFAGGAYVSAEDCEAISDAVESVMPKDFDGDGKKTAKTVSYSVYSEDEIKAVEQKVGEDGKPLQINRELNRSEYSNFHANFGAGQFIVCFVSEYLYDELVKANRLVDLSKEFSGNLPNGLLPDGYGVRLGDTDFYKYFDGARVMPADTVVCISVQQVFGKSADTKEYKNSYDTFRAIIEFEAN